MQVVQGCALKRFGCDLQLFIASRSELLWSIWVENFVQSLSLLPVTLAYKTNQKA